MPPKGKTKAKAQRQPVLLGDANAPLTRATLMELFDYRETQAVDDSGPDEPALDRLFGAIMAWIDVMQAQRSDYLRVLARLQRAPQVWLLLWQLAGRQALNLLREQGLLVGDRRRHAQQLGLLAVCGRTLRAWQQDESPDLAATLRILDINLRRVSKAADWIGLGL